MVKSAPQHFFSKLPSVNVRRSSFNRTHRHLTTLNASYLIPIYWDEVLPGDTFNLSHSIFTRLISPVDVPVMDNLWIDTFYFFVPNRLIWNHWQAFMGEKKRPSDTTSYTVPYISITTAVTPNTIFDYFGVPLGVTGFQVNALPFRAYDLVYNEWFRAEQLIDWVNETNIGDGPDLQSDYSLLRRGKRFDYFTSALPEPQMGDPVSIPLGQSAPVVNTGVGFSGYVVQNDPANNYPSLGYLNMQSTGSSTVMRLGSSSGDGSTPSGVGFDIRPLSDQTTLGLEADLSNATPATIATLRQAFQLQAFNEINARGGTRYTELLYSHFGVISPDARLQRPEYLGGSHDRLFTTPVEQTSSTDSTSPQGNLTAYISGGSLKNGFTKSFLEHGIIIGLACIYSDLHYQQGLNRMLSRQTKFDYYWPVFANLTDQAILNKEIYLQGDSVTDSNGDIVDNQVFGYAERYAEYKYYPDIITGELRSTASLPLDNWHLAQKFDSLPVLSQAFIEENVPIQRIVAVTDEVQFVADMKFMLNCVREMPLYNDPMRWFERG